MASKVSVEAIKRKQLAEESKNKILKDRLLANLSKVFKRYIQKRDRYACVLGGGSRNITISHFFGQKGSNNEAMAFNEYNAHVMAHRCHQDYHFTNPLPYYNFMVSTYGLEKVLELEKESQRTKVLSIGEIIEMTNMYTKKTRALGNVPRWNEENSKSKRRVG